MELNSSGNQQSGWNHAKIAYGDIGQSHLFREGTPATVAGEPIDPTGGVSKPGILQSTGNALRHMGQAPRDWLC